MDFATLLAGANWSAGGLDLAIPASWHQGRTAYGSFSAALALAAARHVGGGGLAPLRSAAISFVGPLAGPVSARARVLRVGKNASWISAEITRDGAVGLTASFVFMHPVDSALALNDCPPPADLIAPEDARVFAPHAHMPAFLTHHFEVRFALPRREGKQAELCWWVRLKRREGLDGMAEVMLIGDALPPGVLPLLSPATPVSSMNWQANLLTAAPATRDGWWLLRSTGDYAQAGCSSQIMRVWNADGQPVMAGMQSVAIFG